MTNLRNENFQTFNKSLNESFQSYGNGNKGSPSCFPTIMVYKELHQLILSDQLLGTRPKGRSEMSLNSAAVDGTIFWKKVFTSAWCCLLTISSRRRLANTIPMNILDNNSRIRFTAAVPSPTPNGDFVLLMDLALRNTSSNSKIPEEDMTVVIFLNSYANTGRPKRSLKPKVRESPILALSGGVQRPGQRISSKVGGCAETRKKRISEKRTKKEAKNDKTEHGMEKRESQSQSQLRQSQRSKSKPKLKRRC
ncbi:hypothetical protein Tco_0227795 [Tanacetum coccineum]